MMTKLTKKLLNIAQLVLLVLTPAILFAPPLPPGPGNTTPVPLTDGLYFFVVIALIYGVKKVIDLNKIKA